MSTLCNTPRPSRLRTGDYQCLACGRTWDADEGKDCPGSAYAAAPAGPIGESFVLRAEAVPAFRNVATTRSAQPAEALTYGQLVDNLREAVELIGAPRPVEPVYLVPSPEATPEAIALCKAALERHGYDVWVVSREVAAVALPKDAEQITLFSATGAKLDDIFKE